MLRRNYNRTLMTSCATGCGCDMDVVYEPVCGEDGVTYLSPCQAACLQPCTGDVGDCQSLLRAISCHVKQLLIGPLLCHVCRCVASVDVYQAMVQLHVVFVVNPLVQMFSLLLSSSSSCPCSYSLHWRHLLCLSCSGDITMSAFNYAFNNVQCM